jgi:glutamate dehydrogenase/leucine dehydrogenase
MRDIRAPELYYDEQTMAMDHGHHFDGARYTELGVVTGTPISLGGSLDAAKRPLAVVSTPCEKRVA